MKADDRLDAIHSRRVWKHDALEMPAVTITFKSCEEEGADLPCCMTSWILSNVDSGLEVEGEWRVKGHPTTSGTRPVSAWK